MYNCSANCLMLFLQDSTLVQSVLLRSGALPLAAVYANAFWAANATELLALWNARLAKAGRPQLTASA